MGKPRVKGADAHRSNPTGGASGGNSSGGGSGGGGSPSPAANGDSGATGVPDAAPADGGGRFDLDQSTKRKLVIGGGVALGAVALYFLLKNRSSDRGGGRPASTDDGPGGGDGGPGEKGFPNIEKTPEDPLAADEEAIEWIKNPEEKAREVARDEMEEEELIE